MKLNPSLNSRSNSVRGSWRHLSQAAAVTVVLWSVLGAQAVFGQVPVVPAPNANNVSGIPYYPDPSAPLVNYEGTADPVLGAIQAALVGTTTTTTKVNTVGTKVISGPGGGPGTNTTTYGSSTNPGTSTVTIAKTILTLAHPYVTNIPPVIQTSSGPVETMTTTGTGAAEKFTNTWVNTTTNETDTYETATGAQFATAVAVVATNIITTSSNASATVAASDPTAVLASNTSALDPVGSNGISLHMLINSAVLYNPTYATANVLGTVATSIMSLNPTSFSPAQKAGYLTTLVGDAVQLVPPASVATAVTAVIKSLATYSQVISNGVAGKVVGGVQQYTTAPNPSGGATLAATATTITDAAIDEASLYANAIIAAAITAAKPAAALKAGAATAIANNNSQTLNIAIAGTTEAIKDGAGFLLGAITSSAITAGTVAALTPATGAAGATSGPIVTQAQIAAAVVQGVLAAGLATSTAVDQAVAIVAASALHAASPMGGAITGGTPFATFAGTGPNSLEAAIDNVANLSSDAQNAANAAISTYKNYWTNYSANFAASGGVAAAAALLTAKDAVHANASPVADTLFAVVAAAAIATNTETGPIVKQALTDEPSLIDAAIGGVLTAVPTTTAATAVVTNAIAQVYLKDGGAVTLAQPSGPATIGADFGTVTGVALKYTQPPLAAAIGTAGATGAATALGLKASTISALTNPATPVTTVNPGTTPNVTFSAGRPVLSNGGIVPGVADTTEPALTATANYLSILGVALAGGAEAAAAAGRENAIPSYTAAFAKYLLTFTQTVTLTPVTSKATVYSSTDKPGTSTVITTYQTPLGVQTSTVTIKTTVTVPVKTTPGATSYTISEVDKTVVEVPWALAAAVTNDLVTAGAAPTSVAAAIAGIVSVVGAPVGVTVAGATLAQTQVNAVINAALGGLNTAISGLPGGLAAVSPYNSQMTALAYDSNLLESAALSAGAVLASKTSFYPLTLSYLNGTTATLGNSYTYLNTYANQPTPTVYVLPKADANNALAIIYGAGIANPAGIDGIAAAAVVYGGANPTAAIAAGVGVSPAVTGISAKLTASVDVAVAIASYVAGSPGATTGFYGTSGFASLSDYLSNQAVINSTYLADVANGAEVAAPQYSHVVGQALAFRAPSVASTAVVPAIFAYGQLDNPSYSGAAAPDVTSRLAAITAGLATGVVNAKLDTTAAAAPQSVMYTPLGGSQQPVYNSKYLATTTTDIKAIVAAVVKDSVALNNALPNGTLPYDLGYSVAYNAKPTPTYTVSSTSALQTTVLPAGAVAGAVAELTPRYSMSSPDDDINPLTVGAILKAAAVAAGYQYWIPIAEAATEAYLGASGYLTISGNSASSFNGVVANGSLGVDGVAAQNTANLLTGAYQGVYNDTNGAEIVSAILSAIPATVQGQWIQPLQLAVSFAAGQYAAVLNNTAPYSSLLGVQELQNYQNAQATGPYVTSIYNF